MSMKLRTQNGYDFFEVSSLLQKSLRRGDVVLAAKAMKELTPHYSNYVWKRMLIVSAEDCDGMLTQEIVALREAYEWINRGIPVRERKKGRIFLAKGIVLLAKCRHSRDADELMGLCVNKIPEDLFQAAMRDVEAEFHSTDAELEFPQWALDKHTARGRAAGKTKAEFYEDEHEALVNASSMFRNFEELANHWGYLEPDIDWAS
jgi:replication-associated recombination protein RarA